MHNEDLALARQILSGDEQVFNEFFEQYFPRLYRFGLSRLDDESLIEDMVQNTMMKAMKSMKTYRGEASMFTWLCQICRNEINMHYRKVSRAAPEVPADDDLIRPILEQLESEESLISEVQAEQTRRLVIEVLDFLPRNYGTALEWKYIWGLSVVEIAKRLELTELAAQSLLARARTAFRKAIDEISPQLNQAGQTS
ncbi:MAG: RNA polymerase sigma factor [Gammaproteobacteria bacterium]|jgi:RNA polymerase sigma-70 factor, ECF subfamily|nr:RNA polymerase sigma factor [Gammaproteobacteria bacterium]MBT7369725.1 RNA polymerase sigma factor [Gammaproteobacteria bacterium]